MTKTKYLKVFVMMDQDNEPVGVIPATCVTKAWKKLYKAEKASDPEFITMSVLKDQYDLVECYMLTDEVLKELEAQK